MMEEIGAMRERGEFPFLLSTGSLIGEGFDLPELHGKFDAVIVDGPKQTKRNSRWAALEILDHYLADEFLVLFDDAGRPGDQDLMREFARTCKRQDLDTRFVQASRTQCLIFTPVFRAAKFF